jgi:hypothetical protein
VPERAYSIALGLRLSVKAVAARLKKETLQRSSAARENQYLEMPS